MPFYLPPLTVTHVGSGEGLLVSEFAMHIDEPTYTKEVIGSFYPSGVIKGPMTKSFELFIHVKNIVPQIGDKLKINHGLTGEQVTDLAEVTKTFMTQTPPGLVAKIVAQAIDEVPAPTTYTAWTLKSRTAALEVYGENVSYMIGGTTEGKHAVLADISSDCEKTLTDLDKVTVVVEQAAFKQMYIGRYSGLAKFVLDLPIE